MTKKSTLNRLAMFAVFAATIILLSGDSFQVNAQRDPFQKGSWAIPRKQSTGQPGRGAGAPTPPPPSYAPPPIESRIEYFKRMREAAVANDQPMPKVTSVLTLDEMAVTGIFKTPRGWAAMVEATPIKLSYTIYPGEKFFDGQLVAVEENRLVFRKVTKVSDKKFVASVENKALKPDSMKAALQGTSAAESPMTAAVPTTVVAPKNPFLSPLDEMNEQPDGADEVKAGKPKTPAKKPVKVASAKRK
jgi:hypothetical protein